MFANNPHRTLQWPAQMELQLRYWATSSPHDRPYQSLMDEHADGDSGRGGAA